MPQSSAPMLSLHPPERGDSGQRPSMAVPGLGSDCTSAATLHGTVWGRSLSNTRNPKDKDPEGGLEMECGGGHRG